MSPVCSKNSGGVGSALILSTAAFSVAATSGFAALLKPMWLSLICTKLNSPFMFARVHLRKTAHAVRLQNAALHHAERARPRPGHALQKAAAIDSIVVVIVQDFVFHVASHFSSSVNTRLPTAYACMHLPLLRLFGRSGAG